MRIKDYTLFNGKIVSVLYDDNDVCKLSREVMEILLGHCQKSYEQSGADEAIIVFTEEQMELHDKQIRAEAYKDFWKKFTRICGYTDSEKTVADSLLNGTYEEDYGD